MSFDQEFHALLRRVLEDPEDDAPRLIFADYFEEHGFDLEAKIIRESVKARDFYTPVHAIPASEKYVATLSHRGFVTQIDLIGPVFYGELCDDCDGEGQFAKQTTSGCQFTECELCHGTGLIGGRAREFFSSSPIFFVHLICRIPKQEMGSERYGFCCETSIKNNPEFLPRALWEHLRGERGEGKWIWFPSKHEADAALSDACVRYGRELVGLPAIEVNRDFFTRRSHMELND